MSISSEFIFTRLRLSQISEIYHFVKDNYYQDKSNSYQVYFPQEYIASLIKGEIKNLAIGLLHQTKLIGIIIGDIIDIKSDGKYVSYLRYQLLTVQRKLNYSIFAKYLIDKLEKQALNIHPFKVLPKIGFCKRNDILGNLLVISVPKNVIPLLTQNNKTIGIASAKPDVETIESIVIYNPFQLLSSRDMGNFQKILNQTQDDNKIYPYYLSNKISQFIPIKNASSTYIIKNSSEIITDYVYFCYEYHYFIDKCITLKIAHIKYHYCSTITIDEMINYLIDILTRKGFDQIIYSAYDIIDKEINLVRYPYNEPDYIYLDNNDN
jgi:hypothetical protein